MGRKFLTKPGGKVALTPPVKGTKPAWNWCSRSGKEKGRSGKLHYHHPPRKLKGNDTQKVRGNLPGPQKRASSCNGFSKKRNGQRSNTVTPHRPRPKTYSEKSPKAVHRLLEEARLKGLIRKGGCFCAIERKKTSNHSHSPEKRGKSGPASCL